MVRQLSTCARPSAYALQVPVNPAPRQELQNAKQTDNFLNLDESLRENRHTFAPESLQYCSQKHCTLVPIFTALHFPEITIFLFPVYNSFTQKSSQAHIEDYSIPYNKIQKTLSSIFLSSTIHIKQVSKH